MNLLYELLYKLQLYKGWNCFLVPGKVVIIRQGIVGITAHNIHS